MTGGIGAPVSSEQSIRSLAGWRAHLLVSATLYCLFLIPAPSSYGATLSWVVAVGIALHSGGMSLLYPRYRLALLLLLGLTVLNILMAAMPVRALTGAMVLLRSIALLIPALVIVNMVPRDLVIRWLKFFVYFLSILFAWLVIYHSGQADITQVLYAFSRENFGNVHNLVNIAGSVLLASIALLAFERDMLSKIGLVILVGFGVWFQWLLESEGSYLALIICLFSWLALRLQRGWRFVALMGVASCIAAYIALVTFPEFFQSFGAFHLGGYGIRAEINRNMLEMIAERPFFGYGMHGYKYLSNVEVRGVVHPFPHQIYLEAVFALGVVGAAIIALAFYDILRRCSRQEILASPVSFAAFLLAVYFAGKGLTDMRLIDLQPLGIFMLAAGLMSSRIR